MTTVTDNARKLSLQFFDFLTFITEVFQFKGTHILCFFKILKNANLTKTGCQNEGRRELDRT